MKLTLQQVINRLRMEPKGKVVKSGWGHGGSWRGSYDEIAFAPRKNTTVDSMLYDAEECVGQAMYGYKGGEFVMHYDTPCNVAHYGDYHGDEDHLTADRLEEMLGYSTDIEKELADHQAYVDALEESHARLVKAFLDYRSQFGQALQAHEIPYSENQEKAETEAIEAIAEAKTLTGNKA